MEALLESRPGKAVHRSDCTLELEVLVETEGQSQAEAMETEEQRLQIPGKVVEQEETQEPEGVAKPREQEGIAELRLLLPGKVELGSDHTPAQVEPQEVMVPQAGLVEEVWIQACRRRHE
ncbi:hypothetical protein GGI23_001562 [Coemansia sp. RSA 2559]|nr:hypothetical protein GGI23_001562 [Coemansia sp. RSA 2559]